MAELLKDVYSVTFIDSVATQFQSAYPDFDRQGFIDTIFDEQWSEKELKARKGSFIDRFFHRNK